MALNDAIPDDDPKAAKQKQNTQPPAFEFTKRKRWADILVSEAPNLAVFVLSPQGMIWYAGPGVGDLLGWKVGELVDSEVALVLNDDDQEDFQEDLQSCIASNEQMASFVRLKCRPVTDETSQATVQKEFLFELRGSAVCDSRSNECMFIVLTGKPYPSKNMAIINTILELKMEHERLSQRLAVLREEKAQTPPYSSTSDSATYSNTPHFSQLSFPSLQARPSSSLGDSRNFGIVEGTSTLDFGPASYMQGLSNFADEDDTMGKKTGSKRPFSPEHQFVCYTCGRTDSPEWRKGPQGPKTLCNACGLRWAKRSKKNDTTPSSSGSTNNGSSAKSGGLVRTNSPAVSSSRKPHAISNPPAPHPALSSTPLNAPIQGRISDNALSLPPLQVPSHIHQLQRRSSTHSVPPTPVSATAGMAPSPVASTAPMSPLVMQLNYLPASAQQHPYHSLPHVPSHIQHQSGSLVAHPHPQIMPGTSHSDYQGVLGSQGAGEHLPPGGQQPEQTQYQTAYNMFSWSDSGQRNRYGY